MKKCTLEELQELGLTAPARPVVPKGLDKLPDKQRLQAVQVRIGHRESPLPGRRGMTFIPTAAAHTHARGVPLHPACPHPQRVISSLHYNHAPGYMYNVSKDRPHCAIMNTAREVLRDALPIKVTMRPQRASL